MLLSGVAIDAVNHLPYLLYIDKGRLTKTFLYMMQYIATVPQTISSKEIISVSWINNFLREFQVLH